MIFEKIYCDYNKRVFVSPDPLQFLYDYKSPADREVVGLVASSLAYGKVAQILKSVQKVLDVLGPRPAETLRCARRADLEERLRGFVHRFTDDAELVDFLCCIKQANERHGSLEALFLSGFHGDLWAAADAFVCALTACSGREQMFLLPKASRGSACKRLALYLRWMVRSDEVDPGGWTKIDPAQLFVPVDTHMFRICTALGMCTRKTADRKAAAEITQAFRTVCPEDPVRYDFALTRFGIRSDLTVQELFERWGDKSSKVR